MGCKIRFGIVGCGNIGKRHAEHIFNNSRAELSAVCDIIKERADSTAGKYKAKPLYDFRQLLKEDLDVVSICTPSGLHAEMSLLALKEHRNVLCEKPMALALSDADLVVKAEKKSGSKFFLVKQNRFNPPVKALKDCVYKKGLGGLSMISCSVLWNRGSDYYREAAWRGTMNLDGGALMTQCSHFLDLMLWIGGKVKSVSAKMANLGHPYIETEDTGAITISFESGCTGVLQYTTCAYKNNIEGSMTVLGSKGSIRVGGQYLNTLELWDVDGVPKPELEQGNPPNDYGTYKGSMSNHDKVMENVVSVLLDGEQIAANSVQGRESIEVMQAAYLSAIKKKQVKLPLKGKDYSFRLDAQEPFSGHRKSV